ncbi:hypothetical protein Tco_0569627 [Tanacetum coccineum]
MKMVLYEAFACRCGVGDVVLRESYKPKTRGKLYYACPRSKPREDYFGCDFLWKEERVRLLVSSPRASTTQSYSSGPSTPPSYSPGPSTPPSYSPGPSKNAESVEEDFRVAGVINKLCEDVAAAIEETDYFIQELDVILGWVVATHKTCEDATAGGPGEGDGGEGP